MVKPDSEGTSIGITQASKVQDDRGLRPQRDGAAEVAAAAGATDEDTVPPREVHDALHRIRSRHCLRVAVRHEREPGEEAFAAHVAHPWVPSPHYG